MPYLLPPIETWKQWSSIFMDKELWTPVISRICSREGLRYSDLRTGYPGSNAVFLLDRSYVVKVYNPVWKDFGIEREVLTALAKCDAVPTPKVVASGTFEDRIGWDYLITEFVEGTPIRDLRDAIGPEELAGIATDLGRIVRALHGTEVGSENPILRHETGIQLANRRKTEVVTELRAKRLLSATVLDELASFAKAAASQVDSQRPVLVQGDLTEDHLLLAETGGRYAICGLIDFGDAHWCPPEYEWPALYFDLLARDAQALRAFFLSYDPRVLEDQDFTVRAFIWTLFHDFGTQMVENALKHQKGHEIGSLAELRELLWPNRTLPT